MKSMTSQLVQIAVDAVHIEGLLELPAEPAGLVLFAHGSGSSRPTLLLVGGRDDEVIDFNRAAYVRLNCSKQLSIIPGATHLFDEPGTLEQVADQAAAWLCQHLKDAGI